MPKIRCPHCEAVLQVDADEAGQRVECPECEGTFVARFAEKKSSRRVADEDDEERPRKRSSRRRDEEDEEDEFPTQKPKRKANAFAIASMCCGIVALISAIGAIVLAIFGMACMTMCCCPIPYLASYGGIGLGGVLGVVGLVLGIIAVKKPHGKGFWLTGIITSAVALVITLALVVMNLAGVVALNAMPPPTRATFNFAPQTIPQPQPLPKPQPKPNPLPKPGRNP